MLRLIVKNLLITASLLFLSAIVRGLLLWTNFGAFTDEPSGLLSLAFVHGVRFDLSAILYVNIVFLIGSQFLVLRKSWIFKFLFLFFNFIYLFLCMNDINFFQAYGKKVDMTFFTAIAGTGNGISLRVLWEQRVQILILAVMLLGLFGVYQCTLSRDNLSLKNWKENVLFTFLMLVLSVLGVRGGLQTRVLGTQHSLLYAGGSANIAHLTSNTLHNLIRGKKKFEFPTEFKPQKHSWENNLNFQNLNIRKPKNIIIIFIESYSSYPAKEQNSFFNKMKRNHSEEVVFSNRMVANGQLSMDAITSVFFGLPSYFDLHIFGSKYVNNKKAGLSSVLEKELGFSSFFIHGAKKGTQFFDVIAGASGMKDFYSIKDLYDRPGGMLATWGVHDEFFYKKAKDIIAKQTSPFISTFFTTSSHTPFRGTPNNTNGLGDIEKDYFASIKYADTEVGNFFKAVENEPWFKDTLFIVTGDHSPPININWNRHPQYRYKLPMLMYLPGSKIGSLPVRKSVQHMDLPVSIFHLLGLRPSTWSPYGNSIFDLQPSAPVTYSSGKKSLHLVLDSGELEVDHNKKVLSFYNLSTESYAGDEEGLESPQEVDKAHTMIRDYIYRLEENQI